MTSIDEQRGLHAVTVTAFAGPTTHLRLDAPREYQSATGETALIGWVLEISNGRRGQFPVFTLHVEDPATLWELHDLIAATLPPRAEAGGPDA